MSFRITLDGQNLGDPQEWRELAIVSEWSDDIFTTTCSNTFTFAGEAYEYLIDLYDSAYCSVVVARIYVCDDLVHEGRLYLSEATIDRVQCTIRVNVSDIGWNAYIKNKAKQKFFVDVARSSDGTSITAASSTDITMHSVSAGTDLANDATCYSAFEVLQFLVSAMSDGVLGFASDFFETGDGSSDFITTGLEIRDRATTNPAPECSWDVVYKDLKKLYDLRVWTEDDGGTETVRVEPFYYFQDATEATEFAALSSLTESVDADQLYSRIKIGSKSARDYQEDTPNTSFTNDSYIGWDEEEYNIAGDCVVDNDLDLQVSQLVVDSNSIENQLNGNDSQDNKLFLLRASLAYPGTYKTEQSDLQGSGSFLYNEHYTNSQVLTRWEPRIHNTVFRYTNAGGADFEAQTSADQDVAVSCSWGDPADACGYGATVPYDNEILDAGGNYDAVTNYDFTLPAVGTYLFVFDYDVDVTIGSIIGGLTGPDLIHKITTNLYETTGAVDYATRDFVFTDFRPLTGPLGSPVTATKNFRFSHTFAYTGLSGDKVRGYVSFTNNTGLGTIGAQATFKTGCSFRSEGLLLNPSSGVKVYRTDVPITPEQWDAIQDNRAQQLALNGERGFIRRVSWLPFGTSTIETDQVVSL
jgi:hypothetical protein